MDKKILEEYDALPFPARGDMDLYGMLRHLPIRDFSSVNCGQFKKGIALGDVARIPETALDSLKNALAGAHIEIKPDGIPLCVKYDGSFLNEEYEIDVNESSVVLTASSPNGFRYAVYDFEDALLAHDCDGIIAMKQHRTPQVIHRVTRSFLTPNARPPLMLDELNDDFNYYPDEFLDTIAHERMNGIWITVYLNDMPCHYFPERGKDVERKFAKLREVIKQCNRYGIKCYLFMSEPRHFNGGWKNMSEDDRKRYPEMAGHIMQDGTPYFCTSSEDGKGYLRETIGFIAKNAPGLGGIINIMCCETTRVCAMWKLYTQVETCNCPRCASHTVGELFAEMARTMNDALHEYQPDAVFCGWFYQGYFVPGAPDAILINDVAKDWPADIPLMRNTDTGGYLTQSGRDVIVQDYSLSYGRASETWREVAGHLEHPAAKIQTCCSHEDATVPYLPVPGRLYELYRDLHEYNCNMVMQCWYFGSYPSVMNNAAGRLSFKPFPASDDELLLELARPVWGRKAKDAAHCWKLFSDAYSAFPEALAFKWHGPMHSSIVFPWYFVPRDLPMAPSYTQYFPKNSGDRVYECVGLAHTPRTALAQMHKMQEGWRTALADFKKLAETKEQLSQLEIAEAVSLQIDSTTNLLEFYALREKMIFHKIDKMEEVCQIIDSEIANTRRMLELCENNNLLGYHAEVESYMFYPEKLRKRIELLNNLRDTECTSFNPDDEVFRKYRGDVHETDDVTIGDSFNVGALQVRTYYVDETHFCIDCTGFLDKFCLNFEPGRLCEILSLYADSVKHVIPVKIPGIEEEQDTPEHVRYTIDITAFSEYRQTPNQPFRFNISNGKDALHELHPFPFRLILGTANPADLVWLRL